MEESEKEKNQIDFLKEGFKAFQENKEKLKKGLDEILQTYLRTKEDIRPELWNLFQMKRLSFLIVYLGMQEQFLEDIEEKVGKEDIEELRKFANTYSELKEEFSIVVRMDIRGEINPLTGGNYEISQKEDQNIVLVQMNQNSGSKRVLESRMTLSRFSGLSIALLDYWDKALTKIKDDENFPNGDEIPSSERETLKEKAEELKDFSKKINEKVDKALPRRKNKNE